MIIIKDIGLVKKVRRLEFNSNDRNKLCSKFCPKITPNTSGLIGTSALTNKYPIIPNTNNDHMSNIFLFNVNDPTTQSIITIGTKELTGIDAILEKIRIKNNILESITIAAIIKLT